MKQTTAVLDMMRTHPLGITSMDAIKEIGCTRLAARVNDLRGFGYDIWTEMVTVLTRNGKARVARYRLRGDV
jgi:hypothetical protein